MLHLRPMLFAALILTAPGGAAFAEPYPSQTIRIVVSASPGGPADPVARLAAQALGALGQPAIVENRPGAGGALAARDVAGAKPDGHTLMVGNTSTMAVIPAMQTNAGYDSLKDFVAVARFWESYELLVVNADSRWNTAKQLIDDARAHPGAITYAHTGAGGMPNLAGELFQARTGIKLVAVPYRSGGELATAVLSKSVDMSIGDFAAMIPLVRSGKLRALAVTSRERSPQAAEIPTMMEVGVPDYDVTTFFGLVAPAGTPDAIVLLLNATLNAALKSPDAQTVIDRLGVVARPGTPQDFTAYIAAKRELWSAVARAIGARAN